MNIASTARKLAKTISRSVWRTRLGQLGAGADLQAHARFEYPANIFLGPDTCITRGAILRANTGCENGIRVGERSHVGEFSIITANRGYVRMANDSWIGSHCELQGNGGIDIGENVMIGSHCVLNTVAHNSGRTDLPMRAQGLSCDPIVIEDDVWLGTGVTVLKGVRIGRGSIIGAGAVVTRDIPPYSVAVGIPAAVTGSRSPEPRSGQLFEFSDFRPEGKACH